jgi:hypothetical protein
MESEVGNEEIDLGIYHEIGTLPPATLITEKGLAKLFGKCQASIKAAVDRGELPYPIRIMGKPTWTAGIIIRHIEARIDAESRKISRLKC